MKEKSEVDGKTFSNFDSIKEIFLKWVTVFYRLGLKPRKFLKDEEAVYFCTSEGWFRLSLIKYEKEELNWLRSILQYLEERSFSNWASSWQNTIIWEEENYSYLIQPWIFTKKTFDHNDPASIRRVSEIIAELYRCGKDYRENKGIEILRERWSTIESKWEQELKVIESLTEELFHEKIRKEIHILKKEAIVLLSDCLSIWKNGMDTLFEHHFNSGVIGHGKLLADYIIWRDNDYYLLNWENLSFQPKIADMASLINDTAMWEPEWILFLINEYSKNQSFWPEEYHALKAMLQYPRRLVKLLSKEHIDDCDYKQIKEAKKELKRKERCLAKVWRELGTESSLNRGRVLTNTGIEDNGKISLVLSPVETWGGLQTTQPNSLIHVKTEQKLPNDIWNRLINNTPDRVFGGRDGHIMEASSNEVREQKQISSDINNEESSDTYIEIIEEQLKTDDNNGSTIDSKLEEEIITGFNQEKTVLSWSSFPKSLTSK